jgi:hypothetical protein
MEVRRISLVLPALLALGLFSIFGTAQATSIYRWTDTDGTVSYGSSPPPGVEAERLQGAPGSAGSGQRSGGGESADDAGEAEQHAELTEAEQVNETQRQRQCERARENIAVLENPAIRRIRTDGGEAEMLTEERREEMLREAREFYNEWCP